MGAVVAAATPLVAIDPVAEKRALAAELGATLTLAPAELEEAELGGVRKVIETSGSAAGLEAATG